MANRPRHKDKDIEAAVQYAESRGFSFVRPGSHAWGIFHCPAGERGGCKLEVYSTPANPHDHARRLRRKVDRCTHGPRED